MPPHAISCSSSKEQVEPEVWYKTGQNCVAKPSRQPERYARGSLVLLCVDDSCVEVSDKCAWKRHRHLLFSKFSTVFHEARVKKENQFVRVSMERTKQQ